MGSKSQRFFVITSEREPVFWQREYRPPCLIKDDINKNMMTQFLMSTSAPSFDWQANRAPYFRKKKAIRCIVVTFYFCYVYDKCGRLHGWVIRRMVLLFQCLDVVCIVAGYYARWQPLWASEGRPCREEAIRDTPITGVEGRETVQWHKHVEAVTVQFDGPLGRIEALHVCMYIYWLCSWIKIHLQNITLLNQSMIKSSSINCRLCLWYVCS